MPRARSPVRAAPRALVALVLPLALAALALPAPAASAGELLSATVHADRAVSRTCHARLAPDGAPGVAQRRVTIDVAGLVRARLRGPASSDWDLGVFDAAGGRAVAGSAHFASSELAEGYVAAGRALVVQACRRSGPATAAELEVSTVALPPPAPGALRLVRVRVPTAAARDLLLTLGLDLTEHGRPGFVDVLLHGDQDARALAASGLRYDVLVEDVAAADRAAFVAAGVPAGGMPSGRTDYRRLADYAADMKQLVADNPQLVAPVVLPWPSLEGRPVEGIEITRDVHARDGKPVLVQLGVHHAREWPAGELPLELAFELIRQHKAGDPRVTALLDKVRVAVVPVVNPDGYNLSREALVDPYNAHVDPGFGYKRKNCRVRDLQAPAPGECADWLANRARGVDPNRNYGGLWGGLGPSSDREDDAYRGSGPFSEPETQNVRRLLSTRQAVTVISNHTYSDLVLRPPGAADGPVPVDEQLYKQLGDAMARESGYTSQRGYELYDTTGTMEDWSYYATGGLGFTFEIGPGEGTGATGTAVTGSGFHPPYLVGVLAEWYGKQPQSGGGIREAYLIALESTADGARHAVLAGTGPAGATIRLHKEFDTLTSPHGDGPITLHDVLDTTMTIPAGDAFEYHANPSTRPIAALAGASEAWTLTCETAEGRVLGRREVVVRRGERRELGEVCAEAAAHDLPRRPAAPPPAMRPPPPTLRLSVTRPRARLRELLHRGVAVAAACSEPCALTARLYLDRGAALRFGLQRRPQIALTTRRAATGTARLRLRVGRDAARRLRRARSLRLTLHVEGRAADGRVAAVARKLSLRR